VLNPAKSDREDQLKPVSSGAEADSEGSSEDGEVAKDEAINPTDIGKKFAEIKIGDLKKSMTFIIDHPDVVSERNQDGLLVQAFNAEMEGVGALSKQYVHQALLIQYIRQVGRSGIETFFKGYAFWNGTHWHRIADRHHKAYAVFNDDVNNTHSRIRNRTKEILSEREMTHGVEQIQLQAVDPNTAIHITVPPPNSDNPEVQEARKIFEAFPPGLQRALEKGTLEDINLVLGKMAVDQAEEVVELLSRGGMLSIESKIIDTTKGETIPEWANKAEETPPPPLVVRSEELDWWGVC